MVTVLFFAGAKDAAHAASRTYEFTRPLSIGEFSHLLEQDSPQLEPLLPFVRFAVNGTFVDAGHRIADGDEIAVLPPVSGG
jgi:molybdopterin converting factor small subunit